MGAFTRHRVSSYLAFPPLPRRENEAPQLHREPDRFTLFLPKKGCGGISLLHFSWGRPRRVLPVILALWSPDFPHTRAFCPACAAVQFACEKYCNRKEKDCQIYFFGV